MLVYGDDDDDGDGGDDDDDDADGDCGDEYAMVIVMGMMII